eukprot:scaffold1983_cov376-Prasinococcus_capsulatus_cf.AAC.17
MSYSASLSSCTSCAFRASVHTLERLHSAVRLVRRHSALPTPSAAARSVRLMLYSASLSSCTSRAFRASVHTVERPLSVVGRARRHAAKCSAILGCRICADTDASLTSSAAASSAPLMSYSASLSSCTSRAFRASVHTVEQPVSCSAILGCRICVDTDASLTSSAAASSAPLMSYSASLSSCTSRAFRASVHTVERPVSVVGRARRHAA